MKICFVTSRVFPIRCGVGDYTHQLAREFQKRGHSVSILTSFGAEPVGHDNKTTEISVFRIIPSWGWRGLLSLFRFFNQEKPDIVLFQWVPFLYSRYGIPLALPLFLGYLRARGVQIQTVVHEMWVPIAEWKTFVASVLQRSILFFLLTISRRVFVSIEPWTKLLRKIVPWKSQNVLWVPIGSSIAVSLTPDDEKRKLLRQIGMEDARFVVGVFSPTSAGKNLKLIEDSWSLIREKIPNSYLLTIGEGNPPKLSTDSRCYSAGFLSDEDVSKHLQVCDVILSPYIDGISTRRSSAIAVLSHGTPLLTTRGRLTDSIFAESPVLFADTAEEVCRLTQTLAKNPGRRATIAESSRQFFQAHLTWDHIIDSMTGGHSAYRGI